MTPSFPNALGICFLLSLVVLASAIRPAPRVAVLPPPHLVVNSARRDGAKSTGQLSRGVTDKAVEKVKSSLNRLFTGFKSVPDNFKRQQRLKALRKQRGDGALSFAEFKFLESAGEDFGKILRAGLFCLVSPEYFFYTYLVIPVLSGSNPWAWRTLPSGFDTDNDKFARERICIHRRQAALVSALSTLFAGCAEDTDEKLRVKRQAQVALIHEALEAASSNGLVGALDKLHPWLATKRGPRIGGKAAGAAKTASTHSVDQSKARSKLDIPGVPWATVRDLVRAVGVDGVPNIWILRRLNRGELVRHFDTIRSGDDFILAIGVGSLADEEVVSCCIERCISVDPSRDNKALRSDLSNWVDLATAKGGDRNEQNTRLALSCLHVCRDMGKDPGGLGRTLRAILS